MILSSGPRKIVLTTHVVTSIGWFGAVAAFLVLSLVGVGSTDQELVRAAYLAMKVIVWSIIVPFAALSLGSGIVSSLLTKWGLFRHYWVLLKLVVTSGATFLLLVHTQAVDQLATITAMTAALNAYPHGIQIKMVVTSGATLVVLIMLTGLAVFKPRGLTSYGQWKRHERGKESITGESATERVQEAIAE